jgi:cytochrome c oxidase cbb3-type subunit 1
MGTMGWVTMTVAASIYYVIPKIYNTEIHSVKIANTHFYLVLIGQLIFSVTMWITGIQQGALWKAVNPDGTLQYTFMEGFVKNYPFWQMRTIGGLIFTVGMLFFIYNILMTMRNGNALAGTTAKGVR